MWMTLPQSKEEQKQALDFFGEAFENDSYTEEVRQNLEELMEVYAGARPFDPDAAYEKLYTIYSEMDMGDVDDKEEFLADKKNDLKGFQKDFLEAWKTMSYKALTYGSEPETNERDDFLKVFEELHESKRMSDQEIANTAFTMDRLLTSVGDKRALEDGIAELEESLGNRQNAGEIYLGVRDGAGRVMQYLRNRLQLFHQFATGDAEDIRAYTPFYDTMDKIRAGKVAPEDEVKKVDAAMHDESLQDMRKHVKEAFAPQLDPVYGEIIDQDRSNAKALEDALSTVKERIEKETAREERDKNRFFQDATQSFEDAVQNLPSQQKRAAEEYNDMLRQNQKVLQDIKKKIQDDPDIADYEDKLTDELAKFEQAFNAQLEKNPIPKLDEAAKNDYAQKWEGYKDALKQGLRSLQQEKKQWGAAYDQFHQKERELDKAEKALSKKNVDLMTQEQLEQLLQDKAKLDQDRKALFAESLAQSKSRKASIDALFSTVLQNVKQTGEQLDALKKNSNVTFNQEDLETVSRNYQAGKESLKALNDQYGKYFEDVTKNYDGAIAGMQRDEANRQKMRDIFEAAGDINKKGFFGQRKNPKIFTDTMSAVGEYLNDKTNLQKAKQAYAACRTYVKSYMKSDQSGLKSGSTAGNTRRQTVVRMLELMDALPEFQNLVERSAGEKDDWVVMEKSEKYTKLDFKKLEASLAKHSTKQKHQERSAFSDIDKLVSKKKEKGM